MICEDVIGSYLDTLREEFSCVTAPNGRLCVVTPYLYPDHDNIEVFVREKDGRVLVSDLGETLRYLDTLGMDVVGTPNSLFAAKRLAEGLGVAIHEGVLHKEGSPKEVGKLVFQVVSAASAVAALVYGTRTYEPAVFEDEIVDLLEATSPGLYITRNSEIFGITGSRYTVSLRVRTPARPVLIEAVSPKTTSSAKTKVNATFRKWSDINGEFRQEQKISLLNDDAVHFKEEDMKLLAGVSQVHLWTEQEAFLAALQL